MSVTRPSNIIRPTYTSIQQKPKPKMLPKPVVVNLSAATASPTGMGQLAGVGQATNLGARAQSHPTGMAALVGGAKKPANEPEVLSPEEIYRREWNAQTWDADKFRKSIVRPTAETIVAPKV